MQVLRHTDFDKRLTFDLTFLSRMEVHDAWPWKILRGDETILPDRFVKTQNNRIWDSNSLNTFKEFYLQS